jgi:hypothetical protein
VSAQEAEGHAMRDAMRFLGSGARDRSSAYPASIALVAFAAFALCVVLWARYGPEVFVSIMSSAIALCF